MKIQEIRFALARKKWQSQAGNFAGKNRFQLGLILDAEDEHAVLPFLKLQDDLSLQKQQVSFVFCREKALKNDIFEYPVISNADFGWNGRISEAASAFLNAQYDVLISFTAPENKLAHFLVSVSRAGLKVGRKMDGQNAIFDLNISVEIDEAEVFISELKKYLKILNTTTNE
ncbi:hypothetical protein JRG66_15410 [Salinimicrobium tongyeongense]|uniref:Uncharacterized protein n=1 Tax=Salinimicrobium tongyeongense TaxID=2809707 RepID=A0ABY6NQW8_9FLAO|nr:hypothetical protein [Salinimicrobium tongyeongense]UZH55311.1 hypothetical protein JRG66_15410 [Salinimicrobium tongyeongense]